MTPYQRLYRPRMYPQGNSPAQPPYMKANTLQSSLTYSSRFPGICRRSAPAMSAPPNRWFGRAQPPRVKIPDGRAALQSARSGKAG
jgi:hypothetical protein